jgi:hypothetical protein
MLSGTIPSMESQSLTTHLNISNNLFIGTLRSPRSPLQVCAIDGNQFEGCVGDALCCLSYQTRISLAATPSQSSSVAIDSTTPAPSSATSTFDGSWSIADVSLTTVASSDFALLTVQSADPFTMLSNTAPLTAPSDGVAIGVGVGIGLLTLLVTVAALVWLVFSRRRRNIERNTSLGGGSTSQSYSSLPRPQQPYSSIPPPNAYGDSGFSDLP